VTRITCELKITKTWQAPDLAGITEESESEENAEGQGNDDEQFPSPVLQKNKSSYFATNEPPELSKQRSLNTKKQSATG